MNTETLKALEGSIAHWEENAASKLADAHIGADYCDLCQLFNNINVPSKSLKCAGCPVFEFTAHRFCEGTPFSEVEHVAMSGRADLWPAAARAELEFLKSLLPTAAKAITAPTEEKAL